VFQPREVFAERAARSRFVEALSGCGVPGDGAAECLDRRLVTIGGERGAAGLGAFGGFVEQGFRAVDQGQRFGGIFGQAHEWPVDDEQKMVREG
jgi:hypothetical protein